MNREKFADILKERVLILDGATGTELQKRGMPVGVCPEKWAVDHSDAMTEIQQDYISAGSDVIYTCTFGCNGVKLSEYGLSDQTFSMNKKLASISRQASGGKAYVAGDIGPTGKNLKPIGDFDFEDAVNIFKEQVRGLLDGGVDFFIIETMMDIQEARAAIIAVKETCDLPVCVTMTFDETGRTLTGTSPSAAVVTLQSLGADAVGCNCSTGPKEMLEFIKEMKNFSNVPLIAKPNAGIPKLVNGKTCFDIGALDYSSYATDFIKNGVAMIGGCCGTNPEYIKAIKSNINVMKPVNIDNSDKSFISSSFKAVEIGIDRTAVVIGDRINPTGKKYFQKDLKDGSMNTVRQFALKESEKGADVLDVNAGMPGIDEKETMVNMIENITLLVETPLCIDSSDPDVIEKALRIYPGRAILNSISYKDSSIKKILPIAGKYGAMVIVMPLSDSGVPETAEKRIEIILKIFEQLQTAGLNKSDIIVDGIVMSVSTDDNAALQTLKVIKWCKNEFKCNSLMGLSNISFGLPDREYLDASLLTMGILNGVSSLIMNPTNSAVMKAKKAADVLVGKDKSCISYINYSGEAAQISYKNKKDNISPDEKVYNAVIYGDKENVTGFVDCLIKDNINPYHIIQQDLIPAIEKVGELFEQKKYFLPQLILSAEAMKKAVEYIEPLINSHSESSKKCVVVIATVKGDVHDIGKNIVGFMMKSYGFDVIDLGKDIDTDTILDAADKYNADIIGLSALMTTTMVEMKNVISEAKKRGIRSKIIIGGAAVTREYAESIGADGYSKDANEAVRLVKKLMSI